MSTQELTPAPRPQELRGGTYKYRLACGNIYVTVNIDDAGRPLEIFCHMGKTGGCAYAFSESISRTISMSLRAGVGAINVVKQLEGTKCQNGGWNEGVFVGSCSDAIAKALKQAMTPEDIGEEEAQRRIEAEKLERERIKKGITDGENRTDDQDDDRRSAETGDHTSADGSAAEIDSELCGTGQNGKD